MDAQTNARSPRRYFTDSNYNFCVLPPELRARVYAYLMVEDDRVWVQSKRYKLSYAAAGDHDGKYALSAQLLVCSQIIHTEAKQTLHGTKEFSAYSAVDLSAFFRRIGSAGTECIKRLRIEPATKNLTITSRAVAGLEWMRSTQIRQIAGRICRN